MVQYARPDADTEKNNWTASSGSDLYAMIDEESASDSDYITVGDTGSGEACTISLSSVTDPASGSAHSVVVRASEDGGMSSVTLNVNLKDGGTSIKNENFTPAGSAGNHTMTLSTAQANNISSSGYGDLSLILTSTDSMGMGVNCLVYHAYFACPDASSSVPIAAIAMNTYKQLGNN